MVEAEAEAAVVMARVRMAEVVEDEVIERRAAPVRRRRHRKAEEDDMVMLLIRVLWRCDVDMMLFEILSDCILFCCLFSKKKKL